MLLSLLQGLVPMWYLFVKRVMMFLAQQSIAIFRDAGIDVSHIVTDAENPSGVALITVDRDGENCIVVASGANATLSPLDLTGIEDLISSSASFNAT